MKRGAVGLLLLLLIPLIVLIIVFVSSKFVVPNPETVLESNKIEQNAQDAINQLQQKSTQNQNLDVN